MLRMLHAVIVGLIGAGIVHAATVILVPYTGEQSLWNRLQEIAPQGRFSVIDAAQAGRARLMLGDPFTDVAACLFSVAETPVRIRAEGNVPFWSAAVFSVEGDNLYSFNDRSSNQASLDLLVATPLQVIELRKTSPEDAQEAVVFEKEMEEAFVVLRVLKPDPSWNDTVARFLASASCEPYLIGADANGDGDTVESGTPPSESSD